MEKFAENCKISQKSGVSRRVLNKICVQLWDNLHCLKDNFHFYFYFILFYYYFFCVKKYRLVLKCQ